MELRSHPAVALVLVWLLLLGARRLRVRIPVPLRPRTLMAITAIGMLAGYAGIVAWYTFQSSFYDAAEPTIPAVAWAFYSGQPLYPALEAPERYVHIYGPLLFLLHAAALWVFGASITSSKIVGAVAALSSVGILYRLLVRRTGTLIALVTTAASASVYLCFANAAWWTRSDGLLILCVVAGLASAALRSRSTAGGLLAVAVGCAASLKLTGALYLLPVLALVHWRHHIRATALVAAGAVFIAIVPFLHPRIELTHYLQYVLLSATNGLEFGTFRRNFEWSIFLLAPVAACGMATRAEGPLRLDAGFVASLVAAMAAVAIAASKPGGGPLHLLPFVPVIAFAMVGGGVPRHWPASSAALLGAFALLTVLIAVPSQTLLVRTVAGRQLRAAVAEVDRFADAHPGKRIAVGYAGASHLSHARVAAVFRSNHYLLDAPAVQEHRLSGLELPEATLRSFENCAVDIWLIPRTGTPFEVPSAYFPRGPREVFPESLGRTFLSHYVRSGNTGSFDVWLCSHNAGEPESAVR